MNRFFLIFISAVFTLISCEKPDPDNNGHEVLVLDQLTDAVVSSLPNEAYMLSATFTGRGYTLALTVGNEGLDLTPGSYLIKNEVAAVGDCTVSLNDGRSDMPIKSGLVTINSTVVGYSIEFSISSSLDYRFKYDGPIDYSVAFEPSGNTFFVMPSNVTKTSYWQTVIVNGVMKYAVTVVNPEGKDLAYIEFISTPDKTISEITGNYDVKNAASTAGTVNAGAVNYGSGSGSYFVNDSGITQYITGGKISLSSIKDDDGIEYFSITGNVTTTSHSGSNGSGSINLKYLAEKPLLGTVERNHVVKSTYMGRDMKYSIYLPGGYDGVKEFPILWLLHGMGDDHNSWLDKGFVARFADAYEREGGREMIIVTPDGLTEFYYGSFEEYFYKELMPDVESKFKVKADAQHRAVAGLSMGGFGTLYYWLKYPDMYCYAYAMSAAIDMPEPYPSIRSLAEQVNPAELAPMTLEMGLGDWTVGDGKDFHNFLVNKGISHEYIARDGGHDWTFWQEALPKVLVKSGEVFGE